MNIKISFDPSIDQLCEIENWLRQEEDKYGQGFYCNWNIIERNFNKKQMVIILKGDKAIGFASWESMALLPTYILLKLKEV